MNYSPDVAAEVRAEMGRRRIGPTKMAQLLGVSRSYLHSRLTGRKAFDTDELVRVGEILSVPASELITRAEGRAA